MTDAKLQELKETARKILSFNRMQLLNKHPFIGNIAMNLDLIPIRDARCDSAMTDGNAIYFDIDFMSRLNSDEIQFVLGHEIWHVVMVHFLRKGDRNHGIFNIACDMEVNQILDSDGFLAPSDALFPNKNHARKCEYNFDDGLSAEEYYDLIVEWHKNQAELNRSENQHNDEINEINEANKSEESDIDTDEKSESKPSNGKGKAKSQTKKVKGPKRNTKKCEGQFDKHFDQFEDQEEALKDAMENGAEDKYGAKEGDDEFQPRSYKTESEKREATEKVREMVISSAQTYERQKGDLPGHIKKYVDKLLESKLPWKELLSAFITAGFQNRSNWNVPNKRFAYSGTYLPSHTGDMMRIAIGIDTSGSCERDCEKFLTEVNAIAKSFDQYQLHLIQCDTEVKDYTVYDENNPLDPENKIEFKGFGGTRLHPIFDYIDLNDIEADAVLIFTDGYCEEFRQNENFDRPIMWMITGKNESKNLEIGQKVYMEE